MTTTTESDELNAKLAKILGRPPPDARAALHGSLAQ
jgi:hypothetical protein